MISIGTPKMTTWRSLRDEDRMVAVVDECRRARELFALEIGWGILERDERRKLEVCENLKDIRHDTCTDSANQFRPL